MTIAETCRLAGQHAGAAAFSSEEEKNTMLARAADALVARSEEILAANGEDLARFTREDWLRDRLMLTKARIEGIAEGLR